MEVQMATTDIAVRRKTPPITPPAIAPVLTGPEVLAEPEVLTEPDVLLLLDDRAAVGVGTKLTLGSAAEDRSNRPLISSLISVAIGPFFAYHLLTTSGLVYTDALTS